MSRNVYCPPRLIRSGLGLSLVELMIASLLGMLFILGVSSLYLAIKQQFFYDEQLARLQENGRFAIELLRHELHMAGFHGGMLSTAGMVPATIERDCSAAPWALDSFLPLSFADDHPGRGSVRTIEGTDLDCLEGDDVATDSDVLAVRRTGARASVDGGALAPGLKSYSRERWYLHTPSDQPPRWEKLGWDELRQAAANDVRDRLWRAEANLFYLREYSDPQNPDDGIPVLCREELVNSAMQTRCLVEGIENMQFELGVDTDGDLIANRYLSPEKMGESMQPVSARIHLLVRSVLPVPGINEQTAYQLGDYSVSAPGDAFLRRVFSTTVQLRNLVKGPIPITAAGPDDAL